MSYLGRSAKLSLKAQEKVSFLATAGQTSKTGLSYTVGFIEVYVNGVLLTDTTDFTATNGNSITFTVALLLNDEVTVISLKTFTVADHYTKSDADTLLAAKATIANFTSTGIDDNATSTAVTITNNSLKVGTSDNGIITSTFGLVLDPPTNEPIVFRSAGTDIARFRPNGGLCFGTDNSAANALDDYEEGTWTPSGTGINTGTSVGYYTKVGNVCHLQMWVHANGNTNGTISGLPFTAGHANSAIAVGTIGFINGSVTGILSAGQNTSITMYNGTGTGTMASGNQMHCAMTYRTT